MQPPKVDPKIDRVLKTLKVDRASRLIAAEVRFRPLHIGSVAAASQLSTFNLINPGALAATNMRLAALSSLGGVAQ